MPGSECSGGRAGWAGVPFVEAAAAAAWGEVGAATELKKGLVWREGSGVLCALDRGLMACGCEMARCDAEPWSPGDAG